MNIQFLNEVAPSRAVITDIFADGVEVMYASSNTTQTVSLEVVQQRVVLPWKPSDLRDYFIVFRRRIRDTDEYLEDLRVRRALVSRILRLLTRPGTWRPVQGIEPMHMFYQAFDWLRDDQIADFLPEDGSLMI